MLKKIIYLVGIIILLTVIFFVYRERTRPAPFFYQSDASWALTRKQAIIRLEDVSPGTYNTREKLDKLEVIADYLYKEGVPFQVSLIPVYKDPNNNVEISIGDTGNPQVKDFIKTIQYMRKRGGMVGLHGYTHQYLNEVTASGFEFMDKGSQIYAQPAYAEERVKKALELMNKAGIPVDYWETPHYTASLDQYKVLGNYFGLIYDPNPREKAFKNISSWDSTGPDNQSVIFVPAPLFNISAEKDVDRILKQLDKNDPLMLASFFYHPTMEFKSMYKMKGPQGDKFYVHETDSYLHRLINAFKERGYKFVSVYDLIDFLPAERVSGFSPVKGNVLLAGDVDGDGRSDFINGDPVTGRWLVARCRIERAIPRNNPESFSQAEEWLDNWGQGGLKDFAAGDFNGDGKKDLIYWDKKTGDIQVALSDGSKLIPRQQPWGNFSVPQGKVEIFTGRFNNSNIDGLLFWVRDENTAYVMLSNENGFNPAKPWLENWQEGAGSKILAGDFNGDGEKDLAALNKNTGTIQVALSDGSRFIPPGDNGESEQPWVTGFVTGDRWQVLTGDLTGEGTDDFIAYDNVMGKWQFILSKDKQFVIQSWPVVFCKDPEGSAFVGDFNGDKKIDLAAERYFDRGQTSIDIALSVINTKGSP